MTSRAWLAIGIVISVVSNGCYGMLGNNATSPKPGGGTLAKPALQKASSATSGLKVQIPTGGSQQPKPIVMVDMAAAGPLHGQGLGNPAPAKPEAPVKPEEPARPEEPVKLAKSSIMVAHVSAAHSGAKKQSGADDDAKPEVSAAAEGEDHGFEGVEVCQQMSRRQCADELAHLKHEIISERRWLVHSSIHNGRVDGVTKALDSKHAQQFFASVNGSHDVDRVLLDSLADLDLATLTKESKALCLVQRILTEGPKYELGSALNKASISKIWRLLKLMKTKVIADSDDELMRKVVEFMDVIGPRFEERASLVHTLAEMQHQAAALAKDMKADPKNESDDEDRPGEGSGESAEKVAEKPKGKEWGRNDVFKELAIKESITSNGITCSIKLADLAKQVVEERKE